MRLAHEIARAALPACEPLTDDQLRRVVDGQFRTVLGYYPSGGEVAVLDAARALGALLGRCDGDTVGRVLEVVDRARARMVA